MKKAIFCFAVLFMLCVTACTSQPQDKMDDTSNGIKVLGELLEGYTPYVDGAGGNVLVPLFPVADKLGIETSWDEQEQSATLGGDITIWVGKDYYKKGNSDPISFGPAPEFIDDVLYVPRTFFQYAIGGYETFVSDGYVMIERIED